MKRLVLVLVVLVVLALLSTGCINKLNNQRGRGDSPVGAVNDTPKEVIQFPDRFGNVADACDGHGHRVYVTTHVAQFGYFVVLPDPTCTGGAP